MSWDPKDGNYLMHLRLRDDLDTPGLQAEEIVIELCDGRTYRLTKDSSRAFVKFALGTTDLDALASKLQSLQVPDLKGSNIELWHHLRPRSGEAYS